MERVETETDTVDLGFASIETRGQPIGLYAEVVFKTDRPLLSDID